MADGSSHQLYWRKENSYGIPEEKNCYEVFRHTGTTLALSKNMMMSEELRENRQISGLRHGVHQVGGDITTEFHLSDFDVLLEGVLCNTWQPCEEADSEEENPGADLEGEDSTPTTRSISIGTERKSFTLLRHFSDLNTANDSSCCQQFTGVEFNTWNLQISPDTIIKSTFSVLGKSMEMIPFPGDSHLSQDTSDYSALDSFTGTLKIAGEVISVVTEIQLNLENGLDPRYVVGSQKTKRPQIGRAHLSGQMSAYFENTKLLDGFINEAPTSLSFTLKEGSKGEIAFELPQIQYTGGQLDVSGPGAILLVLPFQATGKDTHLIITQTLKSEQ